MTPEQFCYWLQGFAELSGDNLPTPEQWKSIREHIATVFKKLTPSVTAPAKAEPQDDFLKMLRKAQEDVDKKRQVFPYQPSESPKYWLGKPPEIIC